MRGERKARSRKITNGNGDFVPLSCVNKNTKTPWKRQ